ncbi:MAG: hypothetical protein KIT54_00450 [Phycisphaeraceae bacterium]|nr:hypothetical protein [Phycisphaeraceae bacterium]
MTTAHSSKTFRWAPRRGTPTVPSCLRLCWLVSPKAVGLNALAPITLELVLHPGDGARVLLDGTSIEPARDWAGTWDGVLKIRRARTGPGAGLVIADASPLAVAVFDPNHTQRPLHVACELPSVLSLPGGAYELAGGLLEAR